MFGWLIKTSLELRYLIIGLACAAFVFGVAWLRDAPIDVFPEYLPPRVEIQTEAIGLSAEEIEELVTLNLEELLSGVPWVRSVRSKSLTGLSSIVLTFEYGTDLAEARQLVQERLGLAVFLPNVAGAPVMLQPVSATNRLMMVAISSDQVEPTDLSLLTRWTIKPRLIGVPGVANVAIWGQRLRQMQVHFTPERLQEAGVTQDDIISAAGDSLWLSPLTFLKASTPGTGGWLDGPNQRLGVHHEMPIRLPEDMAEVAVAAPEVLERNETLALGDIAETTFSHPPLIGDAFVNGGKGLLLLVEKLPSANALDVTQLVEEALDEMRPGLKGVEVTTGTFRLATYVEESVNNLSWVAAIGAVLAILTIGLLTLSWRVALVATISVGASLFGSLLILTYLGMGLNIMTAVGLVLALGVLLDDAVGSAERLARGAAVPGHSADNVEKVIDWDLRRMRPAAVYAYLIVGLALSPVLLIGGAPTALLGPAVQTFFVAAVVSVAVSLTLTPSVAALVLRGTSARAADQVGRMRALLDRAGRWPLAIYAVVGVLVILGGVAWATMDKVLLPNLQEHQIVVDWATPPGTSLEETARITQRVAREIRAVEGVGDVAAHMGRAIGGDQAVPVNAGQIWIGFDNGADTDSVTATIREIVDGYPGIDRSVRAYLRDTVTGAITGSDFPLTVRIYGQSREILADLAEQTRQAIASVPDLTDLRILGQATEAQLKVEVDLERAAAYGISPGEVRRASATVFAGLTTGVLFEDQKMIDVVVWGAPEVRTHIDQVSEVLIPREGQPPVRVGDVADVTIEPVPTVILHDATSPYVDVVANVGNRDLAQASAAVAERLSRIDFPLEYHAEIPSGYADLRAGFGRALVGAIAAFVGILLLMDAAAGGWRIALVSAVAMVGAVAGGTVAVFLLAGTFTVAAALGLAAVIGLAARGVILVAGDHSSDDPPSTADETERQWTPGVIVSAVAFVALSLPVLIVGPTAGLEIIRPMAAAMVGGSIAAALATLVLVPVLHHAIGADRHRDTTRELLRETHGSGS